MLDDHVQLDAQALRVAVHADPLAPEDAADARAGGEPDDAVAGESRLGDDLRDGVARDREPAVLELEHQVLRHGSD